MDQLNGFRAKRLPDQGAKATHWFDRLINLGQPAIIMAEYIEGGIRACELGNLAFSVRDEETGEITALPEVDLVRLALPRRVYSSRHMDYIAAVAGEAYKNRDKLSGFKIKQYATIKYRTSFLGKMMPV